MFDPRGQWGEDDQFPTAMLAALEHKKTIPPSPSTRYQVLWSGHGYNLSGYAKLTRELILRIANTFRVSYYPVGGDSPAASVDEFTRLRLNALRDVPVDSDAPLVRSYTPIEEQERQRYRICFTMMETERVHPDMVKALNDNYNELWTPSRWNLKTFRASGLNIPATIIPLGVNPNIYRPLHAEPPPKMELLTTGEAGIKEVPRGLLFLYVCVPTFRKGLDLLTTAFEDAFAGDDDAALVLGFTAHRSYMNAVDFGSDYPPFNRRRARVYCLEGCFTDEEMARIYNACYAYVCTSRGEGANLPLMEAAACGLPVIAPRHTAHLDYLDDSNAFLFDPEGCAPIEGAEHICAWYKDQPFFSFGPKSREQLVAHLRQVKENYKLARERATRLMETIRERYNWDRSASAACQRLLEIVE